MNRFCQSLLLASVTAFSFSPTIHAIEINQLNYCLVTAAHRKGGHFTILVPEINLDEVIRQLKVDIVSVDCSDSANPQPLF